MAIYQSIDNDSITRYVFKCIVLGLLSFSLCGCLGGTIAQQVARSIFIQGADKVTANVIATNERKEKLAAQNAPRKNGVPDAYQIAFWNSGFEEASPQIEPLPNSELSDQRRAIPVIKENKLVQVEVWSLLIGDEKQRILEKARIQGASSVPPKTDWQQWQIAIGEAKYYQQEVITFLIPPEIGKLHSGSIAFVELSNVGELNIARYTAN